MVKSMKYNLTRFITSLIIILSILILNIIISLIVKVMTDSNKAVNAGSIDIVVYIWMFMLGVFSFRESFHFQLANSVSRKTIFMAFGGSFFVVSVFLGSIVTVIEIITIKFTNINILYRMIYNNINWLSMGLWTIVTIFFFTVLGWLAFMIFYRSNKIIKVILMFMPFIVSGIFIIINIKTDGFLMDRLNRLISMSMGLSTNLYNSNTSVLTMLLASVLICTSNFLLLRKSQIHN
jgi:hypothetical protein